MPRIGDIACAVDEDIIDAVRRGERICKRAAYDISLVRALCRLSPKVHLVSAVARSSRTIEKIARLKPNVVFNLAFSADDLEAPFAGALETLGIPFTGSGPLAIGLANDKVRSRQFLAMSGVPVPRFVELPWAGRPKKVDLVPPLIVKPVCLANSSGVDSKSIVSNYAQALRRADRIFALFGLPSVCDEFILGREFHVALVEGAGGRFDITRIVELGFANAEPGRGFKSEEVNIGGRPRRVHHVSFRVPKLPREKLAEAAGIARRSVKILGIRGYAKVDLRMDAQQRFSVIEVNANPGLLSTSVLWRAPTFDATIRQIVAAAFRKARESS